MRPAWTCLIGIILAIALNKCTEYCTSTEYEPVKSLAKACRTGHATNIIQGFAVGYESARLGGHHHRGGHLRLACSSTPAPAPLFVAFGVAMCGIGMLTLTGNTISMDVFGPVADNANGIGEMGYNKDSNNRDLNAGDPGYMAPDEYKHARQILADLDAVGQHHQGDHQGHRHRLGGHRGRVAVRQLHRRAWRPAREEGIDNLTPESFRRGAALLTRRRSAGVHRHAASAGRCRSCSAA